MKPDEPIDAAAVYDLLSEALRDDLDFVRFVTENMSYSSNEGDPLDWLVDEVHSQIAHLDEALTVARILIAPPLPDDDDEGEDE